MNNITCENFFNAIFDNYFSDNRGYIEFRIFKNGAKQPERDFIESIKEAAAKRFQGDVYFGVSPRKEQRGKKESVDHVTCLWADVDYGTIGHKKTPYFQTKEDAIEFIREFEPEPSIIVDSGGGYHLYWLLSEPVFVGNDDSQNIFESMNKALAKILHGDSVQDVCRVMRVPGTMNMKIPDNPRPCEIISFKPEPRYSLDDFSEISIPETNQNNHEINLNRVSKKFRNIIMTGNKSGYASRSERDHAVVFALVNQGFSDVEILSIFNKYAVGDKYREKNGNGKKYLEASISKAHKGQAQTGGTVNPKFDPTPYVERLIENDSFIYEPHVGFYLWNTRYFQHVPDTYINQLIHAVLLSQTSNYRRKEVIEILKLHPTVLLLAKQDMNPNRALLNLTNGMFDSDSGKLLSHDKKYRSTLPLDVTFDKKASCPRWMQFVDEVFDTDEDKLILQELFGYALTTEVKADKAFFLVGNGGNGKSVACEILMVMLGRDNTSFVQLADFGRPFYAINIRNKLLNVATDIDAGDLHNAGALKTIVSGEPVHDAYKHRDIITFRPFAKLVFAMNNLPRINDKSDGLIRRLKIIDFPKTFSGSAQDKGLKEKLLTELSGIFNWSIAGLHRLRLNDWDFTKSTATEMRLQAYRKFNDPIITFVDECCELGPDAQVTKDDLYSAYKTWATDSGFRPQSRETFYKDLKCNNPDIQEIRQRADGGRERVICGIEVIS